MGHFRLNQRGHGGGYPDDDPFRQFIRRHKKAILIALLLCVLVALFLAVVAGLLLFKVIIPALLGTADSPAAQSGFAAVKDWLVQLAGSNPLQWLGLLLQA